jgi:hypothetical protein
MFDARGCPSTPLGCRLLGLGSVRRPDIDSLRIFPVEHEDFSVADLTRFCRVGDRPADLLDLITWNCRLDPQR